MGLRKQKRDIARARMAIMDVGNVNREMSVQWRKALYGKSGADAHRAQMNHGKLLKAKAEGRKIKKVTA